MSERADRHREICEGLTAMYRAKNSDYGDSFSKIYRKRGLLSTIIRLEDKLNRLDSLLEKPRLVGDESIEDSLLDLANYAIMTVIERQMILDEENAKMKTSITTAADD